jgi:hypothetical protein
MRADLATETGSKAVFAPEPCALESHCWMTEASQFPSTTTHLGGDDALVGQSVEGLCEALPMMSMSAMARTRSFLESFTETYWAVRHCWSGSLTSCFNVIIPTVSRPRSFNVERIRLPARSSATRLHSRTLFGPPMRCAAVATLWPTPPIDCAIRAGLEVLSTGEAVEVLAKGEKSHAKSTATEPATKMSTFCGGCIVVFGAEGSRRDIGAMAGINELLLEFNYDLSHLEYNAYWSLWLPSFPNFASSTAILAARMTFDSIKALLAGILFPPVSSLIFVNINGVFLWPWNPFSAASRTASSITLFISDPGIENSSGTGLANKRPVSTFISRRASKSVSKI